MKEKILWICPSRERPDRLEHLIKSWYKTTSGYSTLLVVKDSNDNSYDKLVNDYPEVFWKTTEPPTFGSFLSIINAQAIEYADQYQYIGFMEDDIVFETIGYEIDFISKLKELGKTGIVHAKDGMEHSSLLTIPVVNSYIIRTLGWFSPPELRSLWADNFWRDMANHLGTYYKFENIMIRHNHYSTSSTIPKDHISKVVDKNHRIDGKNYKKYKDNYFLEDMKKLK